MAEKGYLDGISCWPSVFCGLWVRFYRFITTKRSPQVLMPWSLAVLGWAHCCLRQKLFCMKREYCSLLIQRQHWLFFIKTHCQIPRPQPQNRVIQGFKLSCCSNCRLGIGDDGCLKRDKGSYSHSKYSNESWCVDHVNRMDDIGYMGCSFSAPTGPKSYDHTCFWRCDHGQYLRFSLVDQAELTIFAVGLWCYQRSTFPRNTFAVFNPLRLRRKKFQK